MELTVKDILQKGINAHKVGMFQEAEQSYNLILKTQPNHPDANHNMGILSVNLGKLEDALPFFKKAINAKPNFIQFWLSLISVLISLKRTNEAQTVLDKAKEKGANGEKFNKLEQQLYDLVKLKPISNLSNSDNVKNKTNILDTLKLAQAIKLAKKKSKEGYIEEAKLIYQDILIKFSKNKKAIDGLKELAENYFCKGHSLHVQGKLQESMKAYKMVVSINKNHSKTYNNMGMILDSKGNTGEAIALYKKALSINPDYADCYANMGNTLLKIGKLEDAITFFVKAVSINPNNENYYNSMGSAFKTQGKLEEAIKNFKKALSCNPDYAISYNNMGAALHAQGLLEDAIEFFKKALSIKPDLIDCYSNLGSVFQDKGNLEESIQFYKKALSINPNHTTSAWGLVGTAKNINESKSWVEYCLKVDKNYEKAKLTLSALKFYKGDKSFFNSLMDSSIKDHPYMRSFSWVFNLPKLPELFYNRWTLFDSMVSLSNKDRPFYEFGVWRGIAFSYLIKTFKKGYGFDSFQGLPERWYNEDAGSYSSSGIIPKINGGEFIVGKFEDTLPEFFSEQRPTASLINFDADLYSSTIFALNFSKKIIDQNTILIFDEFLINNNWEQDEYKALNEFCLNNNYSYEVLAVSFFTKQVALRLIDK